MIRTLLNRVSGCAAGALLLLPLAASANLVVDGGFEAQLASDPFQTFSATSTMGGWTVAAGSVDLIRDYWQPAADSQSVDMAGFYQNGTIQQTIATTPGSWYHLTFDMSGNPDGPPITKTLKVNFGNTTLDFTFNTTGITHTSMGWQLKSGNFQANGSTTTLSLTDISEPGTAFGAVVDNVSLVPVPEPTTFIAGALLLLPFGVSTLRILRKNREA
jgi:choice-of-anchor C domain-containing protein